MSWLLIYIIEDDKFYKIMRCMTDLLLDCEVGGAWEVINYEIMTCVTD